MCLCVGVAKLLISLVTLVFCAAQKSFTSSSQEFLFIPQYSPWAELPKWYFYRERREGRKRAVWVGRRIVRGWRHERYDKMEGEQRQGGKKRRKDVSSLCCCAALRVNSRKWILWRFHKTHKRNASFNIINQTSARSTHSLSAEPRIKAIHTHIHARKFQIKHHNTLNNQFIQSTKKYNRWFFT